MNIGKGLSEVIFFVFDPKAFDGCVRVGSRVVKIYYMQISKQILISSTEPQPSNEPRVTSAVAKSLCDEC